MKEKLKFFDRFKNIQNVMMISFSTLIIFAVFIFLMIAIYFARNMVYQNSMDYTMQIIRQVDYDIDTYINYMENISSLVVEGGEVQQYLFNDGKEEERNRILSQFNTIVESREDIANIAAVANNGKYIVNNGEELTDYIDVQELDWYQKALNSDQETTLSSSHVQNAIQSSYQWVITLSRALVNEKTGEREGVFFVDLNYSVLSRLCNNNSRENKRYIFIIGPDGEVIYHPKQDLIYGGLLTEHVGEVLNCDSDYLEITDEGEEKIYVMSKSQRTGWTVVGVADTNEITESIGELQMIYIMIAVLLLLIVMLISNGVAKEIIRPLLSLKESMSRVQRGVFEKVDVHSLSQNEVGSLGNSFNIMIERIQELMEQNRLEQEEKRKSELMALWAQIRPHFLYNTLDSIIWMAEAKKNEEVVLMTSALARLLHQSISNAKEKVRIKEELAYIKDYLTIQKMRYEDKLEYSINVDDQIGEITIIKFTLQPLVENAIYHGLKYKETKGRIDIQGFIEEDNVYISVADDGVGMDEETLEHIFDEKESKGDHKGIGVYNVQRRLQLYYGKNYGITYVSDVGRGTIATVVIPLKGGAGNENVEK